MEKYVIKDNFHWVDLYVYIGSIIEFDVIAEKNKLVVELEQRQADWLCYYDANIIWIARKDVWVFMHEIMHFILKQAEYLGYEIEWGWEYHCYANQFYYDEFKKIVRKKWQLTKDIIL